MLGFQYRQDSKLVAREAYVYAKTLNLTGDGTDIWVFDIDETSLSNLPYYAQHGFGYVLYLIDLFPVRFFLGKVIKGLNRKPT